MRNLLCESARLRELCSWLKDRFAWGAGGAGGSGGQKIRQKWERKPGWRGFFEYM